MDATKLQPDLIAALKAAREFIAAELAVMERCFLPEPNRAEEAELMAARFLLQKIDSALEMAGTANEQPPGPPAPAGGKQ